MMTEKDGEKDDMSRVSCSCMGVEYSPIRNEDGSFTERWVCKNCGNQFVKIQFLKELRTRVAELEHKCGFCPDCEFKPVKDRLEEIEELQNRLSTLLKASEGMEKALNEIADMAFFWERLNKQDGGSRKGTKYEELAKQALADFRAVKETMEKGAGK